MAQIAIVEDESEPRQLLQNCLALYSTETNAKLEIKNFTSGEEFLKSDTTDFDVVFMDIDMPGLNGIETSREMRKTNTKTVLLFVTNLAQYAIAGYEVNALDYILKPVNYYSFKLKIQKALEAARHTHGAMLTVSSNEGGTRYVRATDILYIEVQNHDLHYHTLYGTLCATGTLKTIEKQLEPEGFFRCNYCYLVNMNHVRFLDGSTVNVGDEELQISRNRRKEFLQRLTQFYGRGGR